MYLSQIFYKAFVLRAERGERGYKMDFQVEEAPKVRLIVEGLSRRLQAQA
jgi:hypothetical protein